MNTLTGSTFYRVSTNVGFTYDYATKAEALKLQAELISVSIDAHIVTMHMEA
jgi:hypothetical protein